ncbi:3,4-dihydroxy-2-butanone-4-phosphate synthase [Gordonia amicalis]|uniref:3,4-dihydroxy-2-butanone-4-phosphate synthase n=1 Tax=Gordonia amicalis TaxID=89053 RepID=UPI0002A64A03|nr:3,4-dihydroxy-2-butanone-4-phosphate synthase [Gordonia amicalis]MBA5849671.1 3,4-dihydroxy-2-butanone-4-phosphate synthase [Gordonia amicalis]MDV7173832.1 3,4-dihydroxy-2-butanone-4-phosphate synthase [Gordonia amicalis]NKX76797.1 hypothetical protein [Gordonia amicalis]UKO90849.1 3,4-dihydroxy-2-butanone-4-phosphate synthase [Gordonia amicalis]UOG22360.1 3,4-dihydroxy-2-butanone-4-phosphate synthase [Gordonia amicalis]
MVVLADPPSGRSYLLLAGEVATTESLAFVIRHGSGLVQVAMAFEDCVRLQLPPMWPLAEQPGGAFQTVAVDAATGIGTGISAADRAHTVRTLADPTTTASDLTRPGHVVPLLVRSDVPGPEAAALRFAATAGVRPAMALCELVSHVDETAMAGVDEALVFARDFALSAVFTSDLEEVLLRAS